MVRDARNLVEHDTDVLGTNRCCNTQKLLHREHVAVLVAHHGYVIEPVHVTDAMVVRLALGELFRCTMQESDVRVSALNDFPIELQHQAQHAVRRRVLRTEVHGVVTNFGHRILPHE